MVEAFTKFARFFPFKRTSAKEAISIFKMQQDIFGNPERMISDRGETFTLKESEKYLDDENTEHILITKGMPGDNE